MPVMSNPAYYNIVFDTTRFVHAVILIGNFYQNYAESQNWFVSVGSNTGSSVTQNTVYGQYVNANYDQNGKEIKIGAYGSSVGVYRTDGIVLSFRWLAVFTTKTDCSGSFDWSSSLANWCIALTSSAQVITGEIVAKIDDCAVFHAPLVLADDTALPSFITQDLATRIMTVNVSSSQAPETIKVKACAFLNDKVTQAKSECKEIAIHMFYDTFAFASPTFSNQVEQSNQLISFEFPTLTLSTTDITPTITFALVNAPVFLTLSQANNQVKGQISPDAQPGTYSYQVIATESLCGKTVTIDATLLVYSCNPTGFQILPNTLTIEIEGPSQTLNWSFTSPQSACGSYAIALEPQFDYLLSISGQQITVQAIEGTATAGTFNPMVTLSRSSNAAHTSTVTLTLTIKRPLMTSLFLKTPISKVEYTIGKSEIKTAFPQYSCLPKGCVFTLEYVLELISKKTDARFIDNPHLNKQVTKLPSFLKYSTVNPTEFTIQGSDYNEGWNTYTISVMAIDNLVTKLSDNSFQLEIITTVDCITNVDLSVPDSFKKEISHKIASSQSKEFIFPFALDSISLSTGIVQICGPVTCMVSQTDINSSVANKLPSFSKFNQATMSLQVETSDYSNKGSYYLLFDYYLSLFSNDVASKHAKLLVKLTLEDLDKPAYFVNSTIPLEPQTEAVQNLNNSTQNTTIASNLAPDVKSQNFFLEMILAKLETHKTESNLDPIVEFFEDIKEIPGVINLLQLLKSIKPPAKQMKISLYNAQVLIRDIDRSGVVTIAFNEPVYRVNEGNRIEPDLLAVAYLKNSEQNVRLLSWEMTRYTSTYIQIQLDFNEPLLVSSGDQLDSLQVSLSKALLLPLNNPFSFEPDRRDLMQNSHILLLQADIPALVKNQNDYVKLEQAQETIEKSTVTAVAIPMIAQVVLKGAMKKLWFYFNTMQLVDTFQEFSNVKTPANVEMISDAYKDIINMQMLPAQVQDFIKGHLGIKAKPVTTARMLLPAPTRNSLFISRITLGAFVGCLVAAFVIVAICHKRIWNRMSHRMQKQLTFLYYRIFWNMIIRALLEMFYPMLLVSLLRLSKSEHPSKERADIAKVCLFSVFFIVTVLFMIEKREQVDEEAFKQRYGSYLTNVETFLKPAAVHYPSIFMLRRLFMAINITFLKFNLVTQVLCGVHSSLLMLSWLIIVKPFDTRLKNYLEVSNEVFVLILSYAAFLFSDYVDSPVTRYDFGFFYITLIGVPLVINIAVMVYEVTTDLLKIFRRWRQKKSIKTQDHVQEMVKQTLNQDQVIDQQSLRSDSEQISSVDNSESRDDLSIQQDQLLIVPQNANIQTSNQVFSNEQSSFRKVKAAMQQVGLSQVASPVSSHRKKLKQGKLGQAETQINQIEEDSDFCTNQLILDELLNFPSKKDFNGKRKNIEPESLIYPSKDQGICKNSPTVKADNRQNQKLRFNFKFKDKNNAKRIEEILDLEIKKMDDQINFEMNQLDPEVRIRLQGEMHLAEVNKKLKQERSASISELLSQIRELEERKQETLESDEQESYRPSKLQPLKGHKKDDKH